MRNIAKLRQAREKFNNSTCRGPADGVEFEDLCFFGFPFSGVKFDVLPLLNTPGLREFEIEFPRFEILPHDWKNVTNYLLLKKKI